MVRLAILLSLGVPAVVALAINARVVPGEVPAATIVVPDPPVQTKKDGPCHGGCSLSKHGVKPLNATGYREAIAKLANGEPEGLATLLFHREESVAFLDTLGTLELSEADATTLRRELARSTARVRIRMVDEAGNVHVELDQSGVPLGEKQHLHPARRAGLQPLEISGTVVRVDVDRLWSRY